MQRRDLKQQGTCRYLKEHEDRCATVIEI